MVETGADNLDRIEAWFPGLVSVEGSPADLGRMEAWFPDRGRLEDSPAGLDRVEDTFLPLYSGSVSTPILTSTSKIWC